MTPLSTVSIAALLIAALLLGGCSSNGSDTDGAAESASIDAGDTLPASQGGDDGPSGLAHVHGIGRDAGNDSVLLATHYGLWRVGDDREPSLVGEYRHDFMGFSVVGPDHFVASGHPNGAPSLPSNLGLIESTDGGETWKSVSLLGEVDFHALHAAREQTWGWDATSGTLRVSSDQKKWDVRARDMMLLDFAVSPARKEVVVATMPVSQTQLELRRSTDGGRSFEPVEGAPQLARLTWADAGLFGFGLKGDVWRSVDDGATWQRVGELGELPQAVSAADGELLAATAGEVHRSTDEGRSWKRVAQFDV